MDVMCKTRTVLNVAVSFVVFSLLDVVDLVLCFVYKLLDFCIESEWNKRGSFYKEAVNGGGGGKIIVSEHGETESEVVCLSSNRLQFEEISDTLYSRPSFVAEVSKLAVDKLKLDADIVPSRKGASRSTITVSSTIVKMLKGRMIGVGQHLYPVTRWSDCDCQFCNAWTYSTKDALFVKAESPKDKAREDVLFIHGFVSSSAFWTETLFPNFSSKAKSTYRFLAVDLLGFAQSPKPNDSLYTLREHVEMIEKSVLEAYKVGSFHIVAHSLGCILALAIAVKHPGSVKSLTLLAPPYYQAPKGESTTQYVMRQVAPQRVWPPMAFCASVGGRYEHIARTVSLVLCKNHRFWDFLFKLATRNRVRTYLLEGFIRHTHIASWHTLHNVIFGTAGKLDRYLDVIRDRLDCDVNVFHGKDDEVIPLECSYNVQRRIPRARVKVVENKDHITIVVGRQKAFARELEEIWKKSTGN
ncbi:BODYGUARD1, 9-CIS EPOXYCAROTENOID DIOXYGENASE DEFECTIVE 1 [Hibiscus trionum]|uniref:BODYGUARD1, 9-CIS EPOXYCAROTENOID DIOXYGENASE DEFECTIVE 1 n=1 Tax=Hibiscus trionum TaxID=183268 RepID=A0A9W7JK77_HIBTR|nr:BODYGUARD1, 9-CIS EPOXYCAROTENOID DIOXYGENASE DEFECTIVE 1 [Hibiscus trionum]